MKSSRTAPPKDWPQSRVTITWLRRNWGTQVLRRLRRADVIVTRYGEPWFVLLSPARYGFLRLTVATKTTARKLGRTSAKP